MHISDLSSAVCSVDLPPAGTHAETVDGAPIGAMMRQAVGRRAQHRMPRAIAVARPVDPALRMLDPHADGKGLRLDRSEEHTSELQSLMRISYAVFCLKKKK